MDIRVSVTDGFADPHFARFLVDHYADPPLRDMPRFAAERAVWGWRKRDDIFFLVATVEQQIAGFMLGQAVGAKPWRTLLAQPLSLPFALAALLRRRTQISLPAENPSPSPVVDYPEFDRASPVRRNWSGGEAGNVEFIFVDPRFRGQDIAGFLLGEFISRLQKARIPVALAYIAISNDRSVRAFAKAGWSIFRDGPTLRAVRSVELV